MGTGNDVPEEPTRLHVEGEALEDVLASIRALVSSETSARLKRGDGSPTAVLMLTPEMRVEGDADDEGDAPARDGELLVEGIGGYALPGRAASAPILDEEALRGVVNRIVREELQGELGDRISRNLRKLIRREIGQMLEARKEP
jgi:hypothetical protein